MHHPLTPLRTFARLRAEDGYRAILMVNGLMFAVGYCGTWPQMFNEVSSSRGFRTLQQTLGAEEARVLRQQALRCQPHRSKFGHLDGHATPEEARACFESYLRDLRTPEGVGLVWPVTAATGPVAS